MAYRSHQAAAELRARRLRERIAIRERQIQWIESIDDVLPDLFARLRGAPAVLERSQDIARPPTRAELEELTSAAFGLRGQVEETATGLRWFAHDRLRGHTLQVEITRVADAASMRVRDTRNHHPAWWVAGLGLLLGASLGVAGLDVLLAMLCLIFSLAIALYSHRAALRETRERVCSALAFEEAIEACASRPRAEVRVAAFEADDERTSDDEAAARTRSPAHARASKSTNDRGPSRT